MLQIRYTLTVWQNWYYAVLLVRYLNSTLHAILLLIKSTKFKRRKLTKNSTRLVIVLVGLPARGKSFVARKLQNFITWNGHHCKIFNVGKYRRQAYAERTESNGACDANFFDSKNAEAAALREKVAEIALQDMLRWLDDDDSDSDHGENEKKSPDVSTLTDDAPRPQRIAIFDATNSTKKRRKWVLEQCSSPQLRPGKPTGCVFVESVCDDAELLLENFRFKISNSPDYKGMSHEAALIDLQNRVRKYEEQYETIDDDSLSYIKIFNLSTKILVNHIYGRMSKTIVPGEFYCLWVYHRSGWSVMTSHTEPRKT
jgi:6-phosphofructo-2-kinase/fructose-2,6-biphosphatase 1